MAIRNTEKIIPGGFENYRALGHGILTEDEKVALISYLPETLHIGDGAIFKSNGAPDPRLINRSFYNKYVVFIDSDIDSNLIKGEANRGEVKSYKWRVEFLDARKRNLQTFTDLPKYEGIAKDKGEFELIISDVDELAIISEQALECQVFVEIQLENSNIELPKLIHKVESLDLEIEDFISVTRHEKGVKLRNLKFLRSFRNNFLQYIPQAYDLDPNFSEVIPLEVLLYISYSILQTNFRPRKDLLQSISGKEKNFVETINKSRAISAQEFRNTLIGICGLK